MEYGAFTVRPLSNSGQPKLKEIFKVYISPTRLELKGIKPGSLCILKLPDGNERSAYVWPATEKIQDNVIQTSKALQQLYHLKLGDKVSLASTIAQISNATDIRLYEIPVPDANAASDHITESDFIHWAWILEGALSSAEIVIPGLVLNDVAAKGLRKSFRILDINASRDDHLYSYVPTANVKICRGDDYEPEKLEWRKLHVSAGTVQGLDDQISQVNEELSYYSNVETPLYMPHGFSPRSSGIILYGAAGTGKTMLLEMVGKAGWQGVFSLQDELENIQKAGERANALRLTFAKACKCQPSLVIIDNLELLAPKTSNEDPTIAHAGRILCKEIDQVHDSRVLVIAATRALNNINQDLRGFSRFSVEIEIPVPALEARTAILKSLSRVPSQREDSSFDQNMSWLARQTHGFVAADLCWLLQHATKHAARRMKRSTTKGAINGDSGSTTNELEIVNDDYQFALKKVRPTAMREIFVETPEIHWNDIGGQRDVKKLLERALIWPLKLSNEMKRFAIEPRKGLLLYGPPGCSKTMIARAAATESGYNFLAVKGAELVNMYVGESERAVRDLFQKARSVSPSIIFFDEIDAIGGARDDGQHSSLNIVTTLLNELDGIEELKGVFVLAATNRPDVLDPALTRAGRLDQMIYVGPPDLEARQQILEKRLKLMDAAANVDPASLGYEMEGYSGAEIVSLCQRAGEAALEDQVNSAELVKVEFKHFEKACSEVGKAIAPQMLESYEHFRSKTLS